MVGRRVSVGAAVYLDKGVTIDAKFNVQIGKKYGATLLSLIHWMFAKDPAARPTAEQVAEVLLDAAYIPDEFLVGKDERPFDKDLWEAHKLIADLLPVEKLKELHIRSLKRVNTGGGSTGRKYRVVFEDMTEQILSIAGLCEKGYATKRTAETDMPWEEHGIEFESTDIILGKGYARIRRAKIFYRKRYMITTVSGMEFDKGSDWLVKEGLAHPKTVEIDMDTPWPEHGTAYDTTNMAKLGIRKITRMEVGGEHRYRIEYEEMIDGKHKVNERVPANNLKLMGFIK